MFSLFLLYIFVQNKYKMRKLETELVKSIRNNDIDTFKVLVRLIDVNKPIKITYYDDEMSCTPLQFISRLEYERKDNLRYNGVQPKTDFTSDYNFTKILIENGADLNLKEKGVAPLINFTLYNNIEVVKLLIENGADLSTTDNNRMTPLLIATDYKHKDLMNLLLYKGSNINHKNINGDDYKVMYNYNYHNILLPNC